MQCVVSPGASGLYVHLGPPAFELGSCCFFRLEYPFHTWKSSPFLPPPPQSVLNWPLFFLFVCFFRKVGWYLYCLGWEGRLGAHGVAAPASRSGLTAARGTLAHGGRPRAEGGLALGSRPRVGCCPGRPCALVAGGGLCWGGLRFETTTTPGLGLGPRTAVLRGTSRRSERSCGPSDGGRWAVRLLALAVLGAGEEADGEAGQGPRRKEVATS